MAFSTAARPGSHRKSCFLLCANACSVSKHALGVGDGVCAGSRCMWLQIWVNELVKQEHGVQNVLKKKNTNLLKGQSPPFGNWSPSGAALQKPYAKRCLLFEPIVFRGDSGLKKSRCPISQAYAIGWLIFNDGFQQEPQSLLVPYLKFCCCMWNNLTWQMQGLVQGLCTKTLTCMDYD